MPAAWRAGLLAAVVLLGCCLSAARAACTTYPLYFPVNGDRWNCTLPVANGTRVEIICTPGFGNQPLPSAQCIGTTWTVTSPLSCVRACTSPPADSWLGATGSWPGCVNTAQNTRCVAKCAAGYNGTASLLCSGGTWRTLVGRCNPIGVPVCSALPPPLANALGWPSSCQGVTAPFNCTTSCNTGWQGATSTPVTTCLANTTWSTPLPCIRAPAASPSPVLAPSPSPTVPSPSPVLRPPTIGGVVCPASFVTITASSSPYNLPTLAAGNTYLLNPLGGSRVFQLPAAQDVPAGGTLCVVAAAGSASSVTVKSSGSEPHFSVSGSLGLAGVTLLGPGGSAIGGGITALSASSITIGIEDAVLTGCRYNGDYGGALRVFQPGGGSSRVQVARTALNLNAASFGGGAAAFYGSDIIARFVDTTWRGNWAGGIGGALVVNSAALVDSVVVTLNGTSGMFNNTALYGSAIFSDTGTTVTGGSMCIAGNHASYQGGVVVVDDGAIFNVVGNSLSFGNNGGDGVDLIVRSALLCNGTAHGGGNGNYDVVGPICAATCQGHTTCTCPVTSCNPLTCAMA